MSGETWEKVGATPGLGWTIYEGMRLVALLAIEEDADAIVAAHNAPALTEALLHSDMMIRFLRSVVRAGEQLNDADEARIEELLTTLRDLRAQDGGQTPAGGDA